MNLFGPKRKATKQEDGTFLVTVTPPSCTGFSPSSIILTADQYRRYLAWLEGDGLIQTQLPELTAAQREILMSGIGPEEFDEAFKEDEDG